MQGLLEGRLVAGAVLLDHLDGCLVCRACEAVCPNQVPYGHLIAAVRGELEQARPRRFWPQRARALLLAAVTHPGWSTLGVALLRFWQRSGLQALARKAGVLRRLGMARKEAQLPMPKAAHVWRALYPAIGTARGEVSLFLGCVARAFDGETLAAAIFVLNRLGYTVRVPEQQTCCGALHLSQGEPGRARDLARHNVAAFAGTGAVIHTASGCGASLAEYGSSLGAEGEHFSSRVTDVSAFLAGLDGWEGVTIAPLEAAVAVHDPCSLRNVLHGQDRPYQLLRRIPGITLLPLAGNDQCCGAAGIYHLTQPHMAAELLDDKMEAVKASGARILVTSNVGCAMHLASGLKAAGLELEVVHPVTLLARQMGFRNGEQDG